MNTKTDDIRPTVRANDVASKKEKQNQKEAEQKAKVTIVNQIQVYDPFSETVVYLSLQYAEDRERFLLPFNSLTVKFPMAGTLYFVKEETKTTLKPLLCDEYKPNPKSFSELESQLFFSSDWDYSKPYVVGYENGISLPMAVGLSGGGFRATLMHVGVLRRLNELGKLSTVDTFSSVSGGSIINAILALAWNDLKEKKFTPEAFEEYVARTVYKFCSNNIAIETVLIDKLNPDNWIRRFTVEDATTGRFLAEKYTQIDGRFKTKLSKLPKPSPDFPLFVFCGTDMRNGRPFYFTQNQVGFSLKGMQKLETPLDMKEGEQERLAQITTLAEAVAASSAYPLAFQPLKIQYTTTKGTTEYAYITDGGVYDNLGLDPVLAANPYICHPCYDKDLKQFPPENDVPQENDVPHKFVFLSDAGKPLSEEEKPSINLIIRRTLDIMTSQADSVRHAIVKEKFANKSLHGAICSTYDLWRYFEMIQHSKMPGCPEEHLKRVKSLLEDLPKNYNYPDIKKMFNFVSEQLQSSNKDEEVLTNNNNQKALSVKTENIENQLKDAFGEAKSILDALIAFRTDLNAFEKAEMEVLDAVGYTIAAYRIQIYCSDLFNCMLDEKTPDFCEKMRNRLAPNEIKKALELSSTVIKANFHRRALKIFGFWKH